MDEAEEEGGPIGEAPPTFPAITEISKSWTAQRF